jgi:phage terminase large subunit-like protein
MPEVQAPRRPRKAKPAARDFSSIAHQFEEDVLSGRFPAGRLFRAAIERQRRDLAAPPDGFVFSAEEGDKVCRRAERFPFAEGPRRGQPFRLEAWQVWLFRTFFGWIDPVTGFGRFRLASIWLPKGNGKSPIAALIALCVLTVAKGGDKIYSAASTQKQARHVFDAAREMLRIDSDDAVEAGRKSIASHFGIEVEEHRIKGAGDNRVYEPVSSEAGSIEGIRPSVLILDEVHVLPNRKLYDNLRSAANKVDGSRFVTISTAGFDMSPEALGYGLYSRARDILEQKGEDPTLFALIVEADKKRPDGSDADPFDIETLRQANPNLGVSVSIAGLKSAAQTAREVPSERASFEVKHLGWWQQTANAFIDIARWNALADPAIRLEDISLKAKWMVHAGVDLARTRDLTAVVFVATRLRPDGKREYRVFSRMAYLAEESATLKKIPDLKLWADQGWMTLLKGQTTGYGGIKDDIEEACDPFPGAEVCFDDWCAAEMEEDLASRGLTCVSIRQGAKTQSEPMRELEAAILDGRLSHDGSPVMAMCMGNLQAVTDRNGNIAPGRENEYKKIDLAVALINALVRASVADPPPDLSAGFQWV